jgi:hypothetical protein
MLQTIGLSDIGYKEKLTVAQLWFQWFVNNCAQRRALDNPRGVKRRVQNNSSPSIIWGKRKFGNVMADLKTDGGGGGGVRF